MEMSECLTRDLGLHQRGFRTLGSLMVSMVDQLSLYSGRSVNPVQETSYPVGRVPATVVAP